MRALLGLVVLIFASVECWAHDPYTGLRDRAGQLCCSGEDCEVINNYFVHSDGGAAFYSSRWKQWIHIYPDQITWMALPGGSAHWCGRVMLPMDAPTGMLITFCAFIDPNAF